MALPVAGTVNINNQAYVDPNATPIASNYAYEAGGDVHGALQKIFNKIFVDSLNAKVASGELTQEAANNEYWSQWQGARTAREQHDASGGLGGFVNSIAPVVTGGLLSGGVAGVTGDQALGNISLGRPVGENLQNAGIADLAGAGATGAAVLGGGAAAAPEVAPYYSGADAAAIGSGVNPETSLAMKLGQVELRGPGTDGVASSGAGLGPGSTAAVAGGAAGGAGAIGNALAPEPGSSAATTAGTAAGTPLARLFDGSACPADWASSFG